jgi:F-type H+-transporting ATPase subunit a
MRGMSPLEIDIHPGVHPLWHIGPATFHADTIWCTLVAGAIVLAMGFYLRAQLTKPDTDHVPSKLQIFWETVVDQVQLQVKDNLGGNHPFVVPLAVALFFFILIANMLEIIPSQPNKTHILPAPSADTNLTYALALLVIVGVWTYGIRQKGLKGYLHHFVEPFPILLPLNILEELVKPITLALRLFGNIFASGIMLGLIAGLVQWKVGGLPLGGVLSVLFDILWKIFAMAIAGIQAFIFSLLTILYFGMAGAGHEEHDGHKEAANDVAAEQIAV